MGKNEDSNIVKVSLKFLEELLPFHPYINPPWKDCTQPLTIEEVKNSEYYIYSMNPDVAYARSQHLSRVKYLVDSWNNDGTDTPDIEIYNGVIVHDGYHRIAAAIARQDEDILIELGGFMGEAKDLGFPVNLEFSS